MATTDTSVWDKNISALRETIAQNFQNPQTRDIATHCIEMLRTLSTIERNYGQNVTGKEEQYRTNPR